MLSIDTNVLLYAANKDCAEHDAAAAFLGECADRDARLALTLRHHGVDEFATRNVKDFKDFGFSRVWDPTQL